MPQSNSKDNRYRDFIFVVYPESAPADWMEQLSSKGLSFAVSPLHDKDINPDGTVKKAHYHVAMHFVGKKTIDSVTEISHSINGSIALKADNPQAYIRYMTHIDNPEKAQYDRHDIKTFGGYDIEKPFAPSSGQARATLKDIIKFCQDNEIYEFCDLVDSLIHYEMDDWFEIVCDRNTLLVSQYLKSRHFKKASQDRERGAD